MIINTFENLKKSSAEHILNLLKEFGYNYNKVDDKMSFHQCLDTQDGKLFRAKKRLIKNEEGKYFFYEFDELNFTKLNIYDNIHSDVLNTLFDNNLNLITYVKIKKNTALYNLIRNEESKIQLCFENIKFAKPFRSIFSKNINLIVLLSENDSELKMVSSLFRDYIGLPSCLYDPLTTGIKSQKLFLPGAPIPSEYLINQNDNILQAGNKILLKQVYKMTANTEGTYRDLDLEYLHDLRVATRRARSAFKLLSKFTDKNKCKNLRMELGWIAKLLGAVRDYDVFTSIIKDQIYSIKGNEESGKNIYDALRDKRQIFFNNLKPALKSERYKNILKSINTIFNFTDPSDTLIQNNYPNIKDIAPILLKKSAKKVQEFFKEETANFSAEKLHTLRIAFKGLRYTCEFLSDILSDENKKIIKMLVEFQDCLGEHQDAIVTMKYLHQLAEEKYKSENSSMEEILYIGYLIQINNEKAATQRRKFDELKLRIPDIISKILSF